MLEMRTVCDFCESQNEVKEYAFGMIYDVANDNFEDTVETVDVCRKCCKVFILKSK